LGYPGDSEVFYDQGSGREDRNQVTGYGLDTYYRSGHIGLSDVHFVGCHLPQQAQCLL
jgi:hypothetical protein